MKLEEIFQIERKPIPEIDSSKTAEVSFFRNDISDINAAFSTTGTAKSPLRIYGIVANLLADKFKSYDAFYFIAEKRHSSSSEELAQKVKIYSFLANRLASNTGARFYNDKTNYEEAFLVSKIQPTGNKFVDEQKQALESFRLSSTPIQI